MLLEKAGVIGSYFFRDLNENEIKIILLCLNYHEIPIRWFQQDGAAAHTATMAVLRPLRGLRTSPPSVPRYIYATLQDTCEPRTLVDFKEAIRPN